MKQGLILQIQISIERTILDPKKDKKQAIIIKFTLFRHCTLLFRAGRKLKNGVKLHVDLSRKRFKLLLGAQKYVENVGEVQFVYADVNCILKFKFHNNEESFFTPMQELKVYWISRSLFLVVVNFILFTPFLIMLDVCHYF